MIHIEVVLLILHDGIQVVVVSHTQRHVVRIGLTQIGLRVECQPYLLVLIPVEWGAVDGEWLTIAVQHGVILVVEHLPATGQHLVKTRIHRRCLQSERVARQHGRRRVQRTNLRSTTLQLQADIQHMQLIDQAHTLTFVASLVIRVLINHADDLLRRHIFGIRLARDIERCRLRRLRALDGELLLVVGNERIIVEDDVRNDRTLLTSRTAFCTERSAGRIRLIAIVMNCSCASLLEG